MPGPVNGPWIALALTAALLTALAVRSGRLAALACVAVVVADATRALGTTLAAAAEVGQAAVESVGVAGIGWVLLLLAARGALRDQAGALVLGAVGGALVALAGALPDVDVLGASEPLTDLPEDLQRAAVALALGGGLGILAGLVLAFRRIAAEAEKPLPVRPSA